MKSFLRTTAVALVTLYFFNNCLFAHAAETSFWKERRAQVLRSDAFQSEKRSAPYQLASLPAVILPAASLNGGLSALFSNSVRTNVASDALRGYAGVFPLLSPALGSVRDIQLPANGAPNRLVIYIQDVHMNSEAQSNIGALVQRLLVQDKVGLIALEGAFGPVRMEPYRSFDNPSILRKAASYLLKENKMSGAFFGALLAPQSAVPVIGVDDARHYFTNVAAYRASRGAKAGVERAIAGLRRTLAERKKIVFNPRLAAFDVQDEAFHGESLSLGAFVRMLCAASSSAAASAQEFIEVKKFLHALELEKSLDFPAVQTERPDLIERLARRLTTERQHVLLSRTMAYKAGEMRHAAYYEFLRRFCRSNGVEFSSSRAMTTYIDYVVASDDMNAETLMAEVAKLEERTYGAFAVSSEEKSLLQQSRFLMLAEKLVDFSLTREEWGSYQNFKSQITKDQNLKLDNFEAFYVEAEARDHAIASNLLNALGRLKSNVALVVTGGFHAPGVTEALTRGGAAVLTFVPTITRVDGGSGSAYLSVFAQERAPLDKLFAGEKLFLAQAPQPNEQLVGAASAIAAAWSASQSPMGPPDLLSIARPVFEHFDGVLRLTAVQAKDGIVETLVGPNGAEADVRGRFGADGEITHINALPRAARWPWARRFYGLFGSGWTGKVFAPVLVESGLVNVALFVLIMRAFEIPHAAGIGASALFTALELVRLLMHGRKSSSARTPLISIFTVLGFSAGILLGAPLLPLVLASAFLPHLIVLSHFYMTYEAPAALRRPALSRSNRARKEVRPGVEVLEGRLALAGGVTVPNLTIVKVTAPPSNNIAVLQAAPTSDEIQYSNSDGHVVRDVVFIRAPNGTLDVRRETDQDPMTLLQLTETYRTDNNGDITGYELKGQAEDRRTLALTTFAASGQFSRNASGQIIAEQVSGGPNDGEIDFFNYPSDGLIQKVAFVPHDGQSAAQLIQSQRQPNEIDVLQGTNPLTAVLRIEEKVTSFDVSGDPVGYDTIRTDLQGEPSEPGVPALTNSDHLDVLFAQPTQPGQPGQPSPPGKPVGPGQTVQLPVADNPAPPVSKLTSPVVPPVAPPVVPPRQPEPQPPIVINPPPLPGGGGQQDNTPKEEAPKGPKPPEQKSPFVAIRSTLSGVAQSVAAAVSSAASGAVKSLADLLQRLAQQVSNRPQAPQKPGTVTGDDIPKIDEGQPGHPGADDAAARADQNNPDDGKIIGGGAQGVFATLALIGRQILSLWASCINVALILAALIAAGYAYRKYKQWRLRRIQRGMGTIVKDPSTDSPAASTSQPSTGVNRRRFFRRFFGMGIIGAVALSREPKSFADAPQKKAAVDDKKDAALAVIPPAQRNFLTGKARLAPVVDKDGKPGVVIQASQLGGEAASDIPNFTSGKARVKKGDPLFKHFDPLTNAEYEAAARAFAAVKEDYARLLRLLENPSAAAEGERVQKDVRALELRGQMVVLKNRLEVLGVRKAPFDGTIVQARLGEVSDAQVCRIVPDDRMFLYAVIPLTPDRKDLFSPHTKVEVNGEEVRVLEMKGKVNADGRSIVARFTVDTKNLSDRLERQGRPRLRPGDTVDYELIPQKGPRMPVGEGDVLTSVMARIDERQVDEIKAPKLTGFSVYEMDEPSPVRKGASIGKIQGAPDLAALRKDVEDVLNKATIYLNRIEPLMAKGAVSPSDPDVVELKLTIGRLQAELRIVTAVPPIVSPADGVVVDIANRNFQPVDGREVVGGLARADVFAVNVRVPRPLLALRSRVLMRTPWGDVLGEIDGVTPRLSSDQENLENYQEVLLRLNDPNGWAIPGMDAEIFFLKKDAALAAPVADSKGYYPVTIQMGKAPPSTFKVTEGQRPLDQLLDRISRDANAATRKDLFDRLLTAKRPADIYRQLGLLIVQTPDAHAEVIQRVWQILRDEAPMNFFRTFKDLSDHPESLKCKLGCFYLNQIFELWDANPKEDPVLRLADVCGNDPTGPAARLIRQIAASLLDANASAWAKERILRSGIFKDEAMLLGVAAQCEAAGHPNAARLLKAEATRRATKAFADERTFAFYVRNIESPGMYYVASIWEAKQRWDANKSADQSSLQISPLGARSIDADDVEKAARRISSAQPAAVDVGALLPIAVAVPASDPAFDYYGPDGRTAYLNSLNAWDNWKPYELSLPLETRGGDLDEEHIGLALKYLYQKEESRRHLVRVYVRNPAARPWIDEKNESAAFGIESDIIDFVSPQSSQEHPNLPAASRVVGPDGIDAAIRQLYQSYCVEQFLRWSKIKDDAPDDVSRESAEKQRYRYLTLWMGLVPSQFDLEPFRAGDVSAPAMHYLLSVLNNPGDDETLDLIHGAAAVEIQRKSVELALRMHHEALGHEKGITADLTALEADLKDLLRNLRLGTYESGTLARIVGAPSMSLSSYLLSYVWRDPRDEFLFLVSRIEKNERVSLDVLHVLLLGAFANMPAIVLIGIIGLSVIGAFRRERKDKKRFLRDELNEPLTLEGVRAKAAANLDSDPWAQKLQMPVLSLAGYEFMASQALLDIRKKDLRFDFGNDARLAQLVREGGRARRLAKKYEELQAYADLTVKRLVLEHDKMAALLEANGVDRDAQIFAERLRYQLQFMKNVSLYAVHMRQAVLGLHRMQKAYPMQVPRPAGAHRTLLNWVNYGLFKIVRFGYLGTWLNWSGRRQFEASFSLAVDVSKLLDPKLYEGLDKDELFSKVKKLAVMTERPDSEAMVSGWERIATRTRPLLVVVPYLITLPVLVIFGAVTVNWYNFGFYMVSAFYLVVIYYPAMIAGGKVPFYGQIQQALTALETRADNRLRAAGFVPLEEQVASASPLPTAMVIAALENAETILAGQDESSVDQLLLVHEGLSSPELRDIETALSPDLGTRKLQPVLARVGGDFGNNVTAINAANGVRADRVGILRVSKRSRPLALVPGLIDGSQPVPAIRYALRQLLKGTSSLRREGRGGYVIVEPELYIGTMKRLAQVNFFNAYVPEEGSNRLKETGDAVISFDDDADYDRFRHACAEAERIALQANALPGGGDFRLDWNRDFYRPLNAEGVSNVLLAAERTAQKSQVLRDSYAEFYGVLNADMRRVITGDPIHVLTPPPVQGVLSAATGERNARVLGEIFRISGPWVAALQRMRRALTAPVVAGLTALVLLLSPGMLRAAEAPLLVPPPAIVGPARVAGPSQALRRDAAAFVDALDALRSAPASSSISIESALKRLLANEKFRDNLHLDSLGKSNVVPEASSLVQRLATSLEGDFGRAVRAEIIHRGLRGFPPDRLNSFALLMAVAAQPQTPPSSVRPASQALENPATLVLVEDAVESSDIEAIVAAALVRPGRAQFVVEGRHAPEISNELNRYRLLADAHGADVAVVPDAFRDLRATHGENGAGVTRLTSALASRHGFRFADYTRVTLVGPQSLIGNAAFSDGNIVPLDLEAFLLPLKRFDWKALRDLQRILDIAA